MLLLQPCNRIIPFTSGKLTTPTANYRNRVENLDWVFILCLSTYTNMSVCTRTHEHARYTKIKHEHWGFCHL